MKLQVGVKVVLKNSHNKYLFLRRSQLMEVGGKQVWDIPGGRIESDERLFEALAREVKEETGLQLNSDITLIGAQDIIVPVKGIHVVRLTYVGSAEGNILLSPEHDKYEWMDVKSMLNQSSIDPYLVELQEML